MIAIHSGELLFDEQAVLRGLPENVILDTKHGEAGAFLKIRAPSVAVRWIAPLGTPLARRFTAAHRYEPFWMRPAVIAKAADIPVETQVLFADLGGRVALFVPLADRQARCSLQGMSDGQLALVVETGVLEAVTEETVGLFAALQPADQDLHTFLRQCAETVARHLRIKLRHEKTVPPLIEQFGWCTWDAFYQEVSPEKIREGLQSFQNAGVPVKFLIIDDGWQSEENLGEHKGRRLTSLVPNAKFSGDFSATIRMAKEEFGVRHVLAWHTLQGYWAGVDVESFAPYEPREVPRHFSPGILHHWPEANTRWWGAAAGVVPPHRIAAFFNDCHALLKSQGIDGVKVDNQAALEGLLAGGTASRGEMYETYRTALENSVRKHFAGTVLHCMSCANDLLFAPGETCLTRTSTDFWPAKPETHGTHLWTNAIVSLWFGHFVHPDWDMFQSHLADGWSAFHAAARAISGGPVYVSDKPGLSDATLLKKMVHDDGTVPRCDGPAMPAAECLFADPTREEVLLKLVNTNRDGTAGVIGMFNCRYDPQNSNREISGSFSPSDVPAISGHERYLVHTIGSNWREIQPQAVAERETIRVALAQPQWMIAAIVPIVDGMAVVGLVEKLNAGATVSTIMRENNLTRIGIRGSGTLGIWSGAP